MLDFRLKVFYTVATSMSFTHAANQLGISQPAVSKHILALEKHYQLQFFKRSGAKIYLTASGETLFDYAKEIFGLYNKLAFDLQGGQNILSGNLTIGACPTVGQYILSALLAEFRTKMQEVALDVVSQESHQIQQMLLSHHIDVGMVQGMVDHPELSNTVFFNDQVVLVCRTGNTALKQQKIGLEQLVRLPFLLYQNESILQHRVERSLAKHTIAMADLRCEMKFSTTESVKMYLMHSNSFAFLSKASISRELRYNELQIVGVQGLHIDLPFSIIQRNERQNALVDLFVHFTENFKFDL